MARYYLWVDFTLSVKVGIRWGAMSNMITVRSMRIMQTMQNMRTKIMLVFLGLILLVFNYSMYQNEKVIEQGEIILLGLAPVDPRSLMQGDYMILRYAIENTIFWKNINKENITDLTDQSIVIRPDEKNVAKFVRTYKGEELAEDEKLLRVYKSPRSRALLIRPDTFLFQEGHAKYYEDAKYGVFTFDSSGNYLLTDLADENGKIIQVP